MLQNELLIKSTEKSLPNIMKKILMQPIKKRLLYLAAAHIDETSLGEFYHREYGYAPSGQKVVAKVAGRKFARTNVVAAQCEKQIISPFAFNGSINHILFEAWLQEIFAKELEKPQKSIIILENASFHRKQAIYDIAYEYGFRVVFLPPYSPDYNIMGLRLMTLACVNTPKWFR